MPSLLVIIPDHLSEIIQKGELQPDYYNPGRVFDDVHILMCNRDRPDPQPLQYLVGDARLTLHNHPDDLNLVGQTPEFMRPWRLRRWASPGVDIARRSRPDLIRCHGADWNTFLASRVKAAMRVPYVVSLHINPDVNSVRRHLKSSLTPVEARHNRFYEYIERAGLRNADLVMPVYKPILPYLARLGVKRVEVCYNVLNGANLREKTDYRLHSPARMVYVGRLFDDKDPSNIIRALPALPNVHFTIVGDGPKRPELQALVSELGLVGRVVFEPAVRNDDLCKRLPEFDLFAVHTEYWEISKSVLEALLTGLPCIINRRVGEPVPELQGDFVRMVDNTIDGYGRAISELLQDDEARAALGRRAFAHAQKNWSPAVTEAKVATIYRSMIGRRGDR